MQDDRKNPEERARMTDIERLRHSAAHVLATAILKIWPEAQFAAGPPVENGFYYDVELPHRISPEDFEKIEAEMKKEIKANHAFRASRGQSRDEALALAEAGDLGALGPTSGSRASSSSTSSRTFPEGEDDLALSQRRVHRSLRRPARHAHRQHRRVQANERGQRLLQRRREKSAAPAHLRHRFQEQDPAGRILRHAGGGEEARPPQARQRTGAIHLRRRRRARAAPLAPARRRHHRGTGEAGERNGVRRRVSARALNEHGAGELIH